MGPRMPVACWFACLVCLAPALAPAAPAPNQPDRTVRVLVPEMQGLEKPVVGRLRELRFDVVLAPGKELDPDRLKDIDVIVLPTQWAEGGELYDHLESKKDAFHAFVRRGGGLLVCQPNPSRGTCTPGLLPYPITFQNGYDASDPTRVNLDPAHFITDDLPGADLPFPYDPMTQVDRRYTVLARQKSTNSPSLAVCRFGDGRVVVQTANESRAANIPFKDELLRRMVVWAAGREPAR